MIQDTTLSYLAGFVDGDGHIGVHIESHSSPHWRAQGLVSLTNTSPMVPYFCQSVFGGRCSLRRRNRPNQRPIWRWEAHGTRARQIVAQLYPYLSQKRPQAENLLDFENYRLHRLRYIRKMPAALRLVTNRERDEILTYVTRSRELNKRGVSLPVDVNLT